MGITFRHDAPAGLIGSYAAGQAAERQRRQKYAMAGLLQQQRHRQRMGELGARRGVRGRAMAPPGGQLGDDPIADDPTLDAGERRRRAAARRARARKGRLGIDIPSEWQQGEFIPQAAIDRQQKLIDEQRKWDQENKVRADDLRKEGRKSNLKRLTGGDYSPAQVTDAQGIMSDLDAIRADKGLTDEEQQTQFAIEQAKLDEILNKPEGAGLTARDEAGQETYGDAWEGDGLNKLPWEFSGGELKLPNWISVDDLPDEARAAMGLRPLDNSASAQKQRDTQFKAREALIKAQQDQAKAEAGAVDMDLSPEEGQALQDMVDLRKEQLNTIDAAMSLDEQYGKEVLEKDGTKLQRLGPDKGWVEVPSKAAAEAAKAAKATEDAIANKANEIYKAMEDPEHTGPKKTEDEVYKEASEYVARENRMRMRHKAGGQLPIKSIAPPGTTTGRGGAPRDLSVTPTYEGAVPPTLEQHNSKVAEFDRLAALLEQDRENLDNTNRPQVEAFNRRVGELNRTRAGLTEEADTLEAAAKKAQPGPAEPAPTDLPQVRSDADYDKLEEGTEFIDAETGRKWRKPFKVNKEGPTFFDMMVR